jgi:hypothetical protein
MQITFRNGTKKKHLRKRIYTLIGRRNETLLVIIIKRSKARFPAEEFPK